MALPYLSKDPLGNVDMLELLELPETRVLYAAPDGALLDFHGMYLLSAEPSARARLWPLLCDALGKTEGEAMLIAHDADTREAFLARPGFSLVMDCLHGVYQKREPVVFELPAGSEIRRLGPEHLAFVHAHYHTVDDVDYLAERIEEGMFGAFFEGALAGFIGTHGERAMGLLEILPAYRRHGLASALEGYLINHLLASGRLPFCQVSVSNEPSLALQRRLGLTLSKKRIHWLRRT